MKEQTEAGAMAQPAAPELEPNFEPGVDEQESMLREQSESLQSTQSNERVHCRAAEQPSANYQSSNDRVEFWSRNAHWPCELFTQNLGSSLSRIMSSEPSIMDNPSVAPSSVVTLTRSAKRLQYRDSGYELKLSQLGSHMEDHQRGIDEADKAAVQALYDTTGYKTPPHSLFTRKYMRGLYKSIQKTKEAFVERDMGTLLTPSPVHLTIFGMANLDILVESGNESWINVQPFYGPRPQPDYCVGFLSKAFTHQQYQKLVAVMGGLVPLMNTDNSSFFFNFSVAHWMYFPFLTRESKSPIGEPLSVAGRQNAHSNTLAVGAVVALFRLARREAEIDRKALSFSIVNDHKSVLFYAHYPVIDGGRTTFHRYDIGEISVWDDDGKKRWKAYQFTRAIYEKWMPAHLEMIRSAIESLPTPEPTLVLPRPGWQSSPKRKNVLSRSSAARTATQASATRSPAADDEVVES